MALEQCTPALDSARHRGDGERLEMRELGTPGRTQSTADTALGMQVCVRKQVQVRVIVWMPVAVQGSGTA